MRLLLIVGHADDIFIVNMVKWLKRTMDVSVDVIALNMSKTKQENYKGLYENVKIFPQNYLFENVPYVRRYTYDWCKCRQLKDMLKGRHYDIIHCHYIAGLYAGANFLKSHCNRLYFTFWGGEHERCHYLGSNRLYNKKLRILISTKVDALVTNSIRTPQRWIIGDRTPKVFFGSLGSSSLDFLYALINNNSKEDSKLYYNMPIGKITVQICYSGKHIHQQIEIIDAIKKHEEIKNRVHLVAPMTRGASKEFTDKVESTLEKSGFSYTLLKDRFLTDEEIAKLRHSVDVVLQLSTYDGYSRSIIECLCAGSVFIYGNWLNYQEKFKNDGFEGIGVDNILEAVGKLCEYVEKPSQYNQMIINNTRVGKGKYLWSECIKDWVAVYNGTATPIIEDNNK